MALTLKDAREITITIDNFSSIARKTKEELRPPNIGQEAQNIRFNEEYGSFQKRLSRAKYGSMSSLGTERVIFADRYYKNSNSSRTQIVAYDTFLKTGNDSTGVFTNIKTGLTKNSRWTSLTFKDLWYGANGVENQQVYDGTNVEDMGVPAPSIAPDVATGAAGVLTGDYQYKITYQIDGYQEGNASIASATITPSSEKVELTSIPVSTNSRCTARHIYRTQTGGSVFYFLATISDNTTTTYSDNNADSVLDTTITAPSDYGTPGIYRYFVLHKSRVFLARGSTNKSRTIYSDIRGGTSYPDVFPADNFFDVLRDNGEEVTAIIEDNFGQLIEMKPSAIVKINTDTDDPVGWSGFTNVLSINGCIAPRSAVKTPFGIFYLTRYGEGKKRLMKWNGASSQAVFEETEPILSSIAETLLINVVCHYHNGNLHVAYSSKTTASGINDRVLIIDLMTGAWWIDHKNIDCFSSWNNTDDQGELWTGTSDTTGFLYREDTTYEDTTIELKSELDLGTLTSNVTSQGTEAAPEIILNSGVEDDVGQKTVSSVTDVVSTLTGVQDTVAPSGTYTSPVLEVSSVNLFEILWTESLGSFGKIYLWIRTGDSEAATEAAAWNGPYSTASGSDISAVNAGRYLQYKAQLSIDGDNVANYADVKLSRGTSPNDYVVKITFGYGSIDETAIEMIYLSSWLDFGWMNPLFKRVRKNFHQVRIDFERSAASGSLVFGYQLDGSSTRTDKTFAFSTYASQGYVIYQFPFATFGKTIKYRLFHDDDILALKIKAVHFTFTVEPRNELF